MLVFKTVQDVLFQRKRQGSVVFPMKKINAAHLLTRERAHLTDGLTSQNCMRMLTERTKIQATQQQIHAHIRFTCAKGIMGKTGCRYSRPLALNNEINIVKLLNCNKMENKDKDLFE
jgi:hypothetical protein